MDIKSIKPTKIICVGLNYIDHAKDYVYEKNRIFENELRNVIRKHVFRKTKKYPTIVPMVYFM